MTAYLYTWDPSSRQWFFAGSFSSEDQAKAEGRLLWKAGARGIKVDVIKTVVEEIRG